jgi:hypothetical protein
MRAGLPDCDAMYVGTPLSTELALWRLAPNGALAIRAMPSEFVLLGSRT